jgi:hypothetical protein
MDRWTIIYDNPGDDSTPVEMSNSWTYWHKRAGLMIHDDIYTLTLHGPSEAHVGKFSEP